MLWSKQHYHYDVARWLEQHGASPFSGEQRRTVRNAEWFHMANDDVISMPDKWEYPWYATWDLGFHCLALVLGDPDFAKRQLELMLLDDYFQPNGQLPAYEWAFGDVNPPVHPWAAYFVYEIDKARNGGVGDVKFLAHVFQKLLVNFTWLRGPEASGRVGVLLSLQIFTRFKVGGARRSHEYDVSANRRALHQHHPDAVDRRGPESELGTSGDAAGCGADGVHFVDAPSAAQSHQPQMAQSRSFCAVRRACQHAALQPAVPHRLRPYDG
jgi:hypothetical protein